MPQPIAQEKPVTLGAESAGKDTAPIEPATLDSDDQSAALSAAALWRDFQDVRGAFPALCAPLQPEDYGLQGAPFASPPKWHLAHTTWFFETFLLKPFVEGYVAFDPHFEVLFNSYYNGIGEQYPRPSRGLLSRPTVDEVMAYRAAVERGLERLLSDDRHPQRSAVLERLRLGIEHERQHQELFFTDLKYSLAQNPLYPAYASAPAATRAGTAPALHWSDFEGGLTRIGSSGDDFCFDNELPRHRYFLEPFRIANRLVTNDEYAQFIADGGYRRPELWLSDGWTAVVNEGWEAPLHWVDRDGEALEFTLAGLQPRRPELPVCHVGGYEADAFARWRGARLPTEQEWEVAARTAAPPADSDTAALHPAAATGVELTQLYDACWQWTRSAYSPYPGFRAADDAIGEYNGKFMSNQWVLRGGACVTPRGQLRASYRNFFYPGDRWQFSGIRLALDGN